MNESTSPLSMSASSPTNNGMNNINSDSCNMDYSSSGENDDLVITKGPWTNEVIEVVIHLGLLITFCFCRKILSLMNWSEFMVQNAGHLFQECLKEESGSNAVKGKRFGVQFVIYS